MVYMTIHRVISRKICNISIDTISHSNLSVKPKVVVFLHGMLGNKRNWKTPMKSLIENFEIRNPLVKLNVVSVDLRGHGDSPNSRSVNSCAFMLERLKRENTQLDDSPFILCGHSLVVKLL